MIYHSHIHPRFIYIHQNVLLFDKNNYYKKTLYLNSLYPLFVYHLVLVFH